MLQQILLMLLIFALGWSITTPILFNTPHRQLSSFISLFVGCAVFSLLLFSLLIIQAYAPWSINFTFFLAVILSLAIIAILFRKYTHIINELNRYDRLPLCFWLVLIIAAGVLFTFLNYASTSNDSHRYLQLGEGLALTGFIVDERFVTTHLLTSRSPFYSMFHALSRPFGIDYLWIFLPAYSGLFVISFFWLTKTIARNFVSSAWSAWLIATLSALLIFSSSFMVFNFFYINNHMFTGVHFTLFFLLGWLAIYNKSEKIAVLAVLLLLPTALMRFENMLFILSFSFLLASFVRSSQYTRHILMLSGAGVLFVSLAYFVALPASTDGRFIGSNQMLVMAFLGIISIVFGLFITYFERLWELWSDYKSYVPLVMILFAILIVVRSFIFHFETAGVSIPIVLYNMLDTNIWNHFWYLIIFMFIFFLVLPDKKSYPYQLFFIAGIGIFMLFTIELAHLRDSPYRMGAGDSANRMMVHIVPVIIAYFACKTAYSLDLKNKNDSFEIAADNDAPNDQTLPANPS